MIWFGNFLTLAVAASWIAARRAGPHGGERLEWWLLSVLPAAAILLLFLEAGDTARALLLWMLHLLLAGIATALWTYRSPVAARRRPAWTATSVAVLAAGLLWHGAGAQAAEPPEADRRAILAMAGEYRVDFSFRETVALAPGYVLRPAQHSGATEMVVVVEDTPQRISLQHILVMGDEHHVVKHWRQDWVWQPSQTWRFEGHHRWTRQTLHPEQSSGHWEQSVWEVDDSPRYFGLGRWQHEDGVSSWTSAPSPRPLPRREYTTRDDYDIVLAVNRHALTPEGWVHEQDNTKLVARDARRQALAREVGVNTYTRLAPMAYDFTAGQHYWNRTAEYWYRVRDSWQQRLNRQPQLQLRTRVNEQRLYEVMFELAERDPPPATLEIRSAIDRFVVPPAE